MPSSKNNIMNVLNIIYYLKRRLLDMYQTLLLAKKTSKDDYTTHMRFVLLGMGVVGAMGFTIKLIGEFLTSKT
jgi:protein transport protein SEC61 subunit gamma and related proteins